MKNTEKLFDHETLNYDESNSILKEILQKSIMMNKFLHFWPFIKWRYQLEEIEGFRDALIDLSISVDFNDLDTIDLWTVEMEKTLLIFLRFLHL